MELHVDIIISILVGAGSALYIISILIQYFKNQKTATGWLE
jgi:hypothetical protein